MTEDEQLERLETSLWRSETRFDRTYMESVLAPDFFEFGRSGRAYARAEILSFEPSEIDAHVSDFRIVAVAEGVRLVTYRSAVHTAHGIEQARRSSLWVRSGASWRLTFHQGTPTG